MVKVKVKFSLEQATEVQRESRYIALFFLQPRRQMGVGGQRHGPAALPPGKTRYPFYRRVGGPQGRSGRVRKISPSSGFDPRIASPQRVAIQTELSRPLVVVRSCLFQAVTQLGRLPSSKFAHLMAKQHDLWLNHTSQQILCHFPSGSQIPRRT